jgi:hypothetical protein
MNDIEIWELRFTANVAINFEYTEEDTVAIREAIVEAINKNSKNRLLLGDARLVVEQKIP